MLPVQRILRRILVLTLLASLAVQVAFGSPEIPGAPQETPIAIIGGVIHPVSGPPIEKGTLVFDQGRVTAIGKRVRIPAGAKRIEVPNRHVYPGLINAYSNLGLVEIGAVRATRDYAESGRINPNVKAEVAVNPDSELIPVTRAGGILLSLSAPSGGLISGTSAMLQLDGWTWQQMTLKAPVGMHLNWPRMVPAVDWRFAESKQEQAKQRDEALALLEQTFADARAYQKARAAGAADGQRHPLDSRWEAMLPVLEGDLPLVVAADEIQQIQAAVAFAQRQGLRLILYGGYDAPHCAALLKKHQVPVIVSSIHRLPRRRWDDYDAAYSLPERLRSASIKFCISAGGTSASNSRNLPYQAATAVGYGLPQKEALKAITLYPAEILGVADRVGSLEIGKDATLIITDGDPLETSTHVQSAFIQGRQVDLSNRHKRLWRKYQEKYRRLEASGNSGE